MFIQTQDTPNPATLKFIPGVPVMSQGTADFADMDVSQSIAIGAAAFSSRWRYKCISRADFVAVTKAESLEWFALKPAILAGIMEHYASGLPVIEDGAMLDDHTKILLTVRPFNKSNSCWTREFVRQWRWMAVISYFMI